MIAHPPSRQDRPAFGAAIKASGLIGSILAVGLLATALASFHPGRSHQAVAPHSEASQSIRLDRNVGRSGSITGYQLLL
jgi:hypothetical protein